MSGVFEFDLDRAAEEIREEKRTTLLASLDNAPSTNEDTNKEPFVPSKALVIVQFGVPHILYYQGTAISYYLEGMIARDVAEEMVGEHPLDGTYVWSGSVSGGWIRNLEGDDYDEKLKGAIRPATAEEWQAFIRDETIWDHDEMHAWLTWSFKQSQVDF